MNYFTLLFLSISVTSHLLPQWQMQESGTTEDLNDVTILNQNSAVVLGDNGIILKTTNNGTNWLLRNSGTTSNLNAISFRDDQNGIVVGDGIICRTADGGESWSAENYTNQFLTVTYREPYFFGPYIIICADNGLIRYSADDGSNWIDSIIIPNESIIASGFGYNISPSPHVPLVYIASTNRTGVSLAFVNWNLYDNPINPAWDILTGGEFYEGNQYLVGYGGNPGPIPLLLKRIDSDTTWESIYSFVPAPYIPKDISSLDDILLVCGSYGKIFRSDNRGNSWTEQFTTSAETLNSISFKYDSIGYSVGENGTILFTSNGGISSVKAVQQPLGYYLSQNYPNPFNPSTKIEFLIREYGPVTLKVYNLLGNEIATLVNEEKSAGEYSVLFDAEIYRDASLPSGVYFYQLITGNYTEIKKMVLTK